MNQELKLKWHSIYGQILFDRKLTVAWKQVEDNKGSGGIDNETIDSFKADEENKMDSYIRQRLRVAMIHHHPTQRKGWAMTTKWNIEYFCRIGLIPSNWLYYSKMFGYTLEQYIERQTRKIRNKTEKSIAKLKEKGQEYYTPDRLAKIANAQRYALT